MLVILWSRQLRRVSCVLEIPTEGKDVVMEENRKPIALRVPPQFRQDYEKHMDALKMKDGQESRRSFSDALLTGYLYASPRKFLACDVRSASVRSLVSADAFDAVIEYISSTEHHVPFSVFTYNALIGYFSSRGIRNVVDDRYNLYISGSATARQMLEEVAISHGEHLGIFS